MSFHSLLSGEDDGEEESDGWMNGRIANHWVCVCVCVCRIYNSKLDFEHGFVNLEWWSTDWADQPFDSDSD